MNSIGVMEIFFGSPWPEQERLAYAAFLKKHGFGFYLYGPKADAYLRRQWTKPWPAEYISHLRMLADEYHKHELKFGVVLSPFGLHEQIQQNSAALLKEKINILTEAGIDMLGVFFDDMPNAPGLARRQIEVLNMVQSYTKLPLIFCPTFYTFDPILDKVFGQRAPDFLEEIGAGVPADIEILWTGPKVISQEISSEHLAEVAQLLRRRPFICDNFFANDGPKNCNFIKLKNPAGISLESLAQASYWAFNPMNQPQLSRLVLLAGMEALTSSKSEKNHLYAALQNCSKNFASWLQKHQELLLVKGLQTISETDKQSLLSELSTFTDPSAREIADWLVGKYVVGNECLTD
jgi:hypothetical protein